MKNLTYFPIIYFALILPFLCLQFGMHLANLSMLVASFLLAVPLGFLYCNIKKMRVMAKEASVHVPRSWLSLPIILICSGTYLYVHPTNLALVKFLFADNHQPIFFGLFGCSVGFMVGQLVWAKHQLTQLSRGACT